LNRKTRALKRDTMDCRFCVAEKGSSGQVGQWMSVESVVVAVRSEGTICGKEKSLSVWRVFRVRYVRERQAQGRGELPVWLGGVEIWEGQKEGSTGVVRSKLDKVSVWSTALLVDIYFGSIMAVSLMLVRGITSCRMGAMRPSVELPERRMSCKIG